MSETFDPYHEWLGIPASLQPANHYRLLGIAAFEENSTVIANAADQRMMILRTFQTGKHATESQKLLNEVAAAKVCLLNAEKRPPTTHSCERSFRTGVYNRHCHRRHRRPGLAIRLPPARAWRRLSPSIRSCTPPL